MQKLMVAAVCAAFLSGCGGGGDSGPSAPAAPPAPASTNVDAAVKSFVRSARSYSLAGTSSQGVAFTATLAAAPGPTQTFQGKSYDSTNLTLNLFKGGVSQSAGTSVQWYVPGTTTTPFSTDGRSCTFTTASTPLPTSAGVGASGAYYVASNYTGCTKPSEAGGPSGLTSGTTTGTWSVESQGSLTFVCVNTSFKYIGTSTQAICAEVVDSAGTLGTHARYAIKDADGSTLTLTN